MRCNSCRGQIELLTVLEYSPRSWPHLQTLQYVCPQCGARLYLRFETDAAHLVRPSSVLGPQWDYLDTEERTGISVRSEPRGLHVRINRVKYFVPAK
jgi:hypothetical protein